MAESIKLSYWAMECPVCFEVMLDEIYLCSKGHSVCSECIKKGLKNCPECRSSLGTQRNYKLEELICQCKTIYEFVENMNTVPCSFAEDGCKDRFSPLDLKNHEDTCVFRLVSCVFGCGKFFKKSELPEHESQCPSRELKCHYSKNGCTAKLKIVELERHEEICEYRLVLTKKFNQNLLRCHKCNSYLLSSPIMCFPDNSYGCSECLSRIENGTQRFLQLAMEIDQIVKFPCSYQKNGCDNIINLSQCYWHEKGCEFRDIKCKICGCFICIKNLKDHLDTSHKEPEYLLLEKLSDDRFFIKVHLETLEDFKKLLVYENDVYYFRVQVRSGGDKILFSVFYIGSAGACSSMKYCIECKKDGNKIRREAYCTSDSCPEDLYIFKDDRLIEFETKEFYRYFDPDDGHIFLYILV